MAGADARPWVQVFEMVAKPAMEKISNASAVGNRFLYLLKTTGRNHYSALISTSKSSTKNNINNDTTQSNIYSRTNS